MTFEKGYSYDDLSAPVNWSHNKPFVFKFRLPWPWRSWGFFTRREYTAYTSFGGTGGHSSTQWHIKRLGSMVAHSGYGHYVNGKYVRLPLEGEYRNCSCYIAGRDYCPSESHVDGEPTRPAYSPEEK